MPERGSDKSACRSTQVLVGRQVAGENRRPPSTKLAICGDTSLEQHDKRVEAFRLSDLQGALDVQKVLQNRLRDNPIRVAALSNPEDDRLDAVDLGTGEGHGAGSKVGARMKRIVR